MRELLDDRQSVRPLSTMSVLRPFIGMCPFLGVSERDSIQQPVWVALLSS